MAKIPRLLSDTAILTNSGVIGLPMETILTLIGNPAPRFELPCTRFPDPSRTRVSLDQYRGRWLVLVFYPSDFSLVCPTELRGLEPAVRRVHRPGLRAAGNQLRLGRVARAMDGDSGRQGRTGGAQFPAGQRSGWFGRAGLRCVSGRQARSRQGALHHRSRGIDPVSRGPQPERRPSQPGGVAGTGGAANRWAVPRRMDGRSPDARPVRGVAAGPVLFPLSHRGRGGLGNLRRVYLRPRSSARPSGGSQGLQARLSGDSQRRPGRGSRRGRAQSPQPVHNLRGGRYRGHSDHHHGVHFRRAALQDPAPEPAAPG